MQGNLTEMAELINFDFTGESRAEFGPVDLTQGWTMFANVKESTTIYMRKDMVYGMITLWWRPIVDIPDGWHICDGTDGYPDLRNLFVVGAGDVFDPCEDYQTNITPGAGDHAHGVVFIAKKPFA